MKRLLLIGLLFWAVGQHNAFAQGSYTDDIYFNSADIEKQKQEDRKRAEAEANKRAQQNTSNSSGSDEYGNGNNQNTARSYDNDGYIDYDNDEYYYSTRMRRFNQPFYNVGYFSPFYNPFSYDPFWFDPYWGWSPWARPGITVSIGMGPYWNSFGGWNAWYGYPGFYSAWNYPVYANWYGNYYSGFWNGYYGGMGNNFGSSGRTITYGPRNSTNFANNAGMRSAGLKNVSTNPGSGPRPGLRTTNTERGIEQPNRNGIENGRAVNGRVANERGAVGRPDGQSVREAATPVERPGRQVFSREAESYRQGAEQAPQMNQRGAERPQGGQTPRYEAPRQQRYEAPQQQRMETPRQQRYEAPRQQRIEAPRQQRYEAPRQSAPRMSAPARSMPSMSAPSRSMPSGGGGGGRSMRR